MEQSVDVGGELPLVVELSSRGARREGSRHREKREQHDRRPIVLLILKLRSQLESPRGLLLRTESLARRLQARRGRRLDRGAKQVCDLRGPADCRNTLARSQRTGRTRPLWAIGGRLRTLRDPDVVFDV